jgi:hypothetical protein
MSHKVRANDKDQWLVLEFENLGHTYSLSSKPKSDYNLDSKVLLVFFIILDNQIASNFYIDLLNLQG